jgi:hypothetical protein
MSNPGGPLVASNPGSFLASAEEAAVRTTGVLSDVAFKPCKEALHSSSPDDGMSAAQIRQIRSTLCAEVGLSGSGGQRDERAPIKTTSAPGPSSTSAAVADTGNIVLRETEPAGRANRKERFTRRSR